MRRAAWAALLVFSLFFAWPGLMLLIYLFFSISILGGWFFGILLFCLFIAIIVDVMVFRNCDNQVVLALLTLQGILILISFSSFAPRLFTGLVALTGLAAYLWAGFSILTYRDVSPWRTYFSSTVGLLIAGAAAIFFILLGIDFGV
ncbi:MAG: hypothetical protein AB7F40_04155 [Victivallaceae bacterium]|nr:hypothetical protein [Victivallaceae bacterium]